MDNIGSEVSQKIRAAIKAKLIELGAYVDDELPDYIMVMVANKRSKSQMEEDLILFLNANTKIFTSWLHSVLKKLQEVTVAASDKKAIEEKNKKRNRSTSKDSKEVDNKGKKKHGKRHKEKKSKKDKHRSKDKESIKLKSSNGKRKELAGSSDWKEESPKKKKLKKEKNKMGLNKEVGRAIIGNLKEKHKGLDSSKDQKGLAEEGKNKDDVTVESQDDEPQVKRIEDFEDGPVENTAATVEAGPIVGESKAIDNEVLIEEINGSSSIPKETTVMVPTRELLREHDKLTSQELVSTKVLDKMSASQGDSNDSMSPEEIRKELLLSRARKKLEESNQQHRMKSNSPEIVILEEKPAAIVPESRTEPSSKTGRKPKEEEYRKKSSPVSLRSLTPSSYGRLSMSENSSRHSSVPVKKKILSSHIVAPPEPLEPEIASVVKVKPREFVPKEKQANKNLILKAVAAAERSVAVAPPRKLVDDAEKPKAIFTKDLREKRFENFAVTVPASKERLNREDSRIGKEEMEGERAATKVPLSKALLEGGEEQFISSKTSVKNKNELFIKTWLEGIERAVQNDGLLKPDEIEDRLSGDEELPEAEVSGSEERIKATQDGPQIVVTVDGFTSKRMTSMKVADAPSSSKVSKEINRISDRFAKISQPAEEHEFKEKYREFERARTEKKLTQGESKNKRLILELSKKFGLVDREFDNVDRETNRKRKIVEEERSKKREKKSSRVSDEQAESSKEKSSEKCRFWPDCVRGAACEFHHPSSICKLLPNCKFKEKCLYIHPVCRKDLDCSLRDCPYEHTRRRKSDSRDSHRKPLCKYDSRCKKSACSYLHSKKPCRYGSRCSNPDCTFSHRRTSPAC